MSNHNVEDLRLQKEQNVKHIASLNSSVILMQHVKKSLEESNKQINLALEEQLKINFK